MPRIHRPGAARGLNRAFTMIELLIVVGIIGILIGISLFVGAQVMGGAKTRATEDTLRILDNALQDYIAATGGNPPATYVIPGGTTVIPIADARDMTNTAASPPSYEGALAGNQMINSAGLFFAEASKVASTKAILDNIPSKYLRIYDPDDATANSQPALMTPFDGWGRPIRFVHPTWQGVVTGDIMAATTAADQPRSTAQVLPLTPPQTYLITNLRRNHQPTSGTAAQSQPDSDGGMCIGYRPYFYALGPDGRAGVRLDTSTPPKVIENYNADNVYLGPPNFTDK
jgi:prepilin-type N-terminal cleavage/methylation domain-containing protein